MEGEPHISNGQLSVSATRGLLGRQDHDGHLCYPHHCPCESVNSAISQGAVKLRVTGVEETEMLGLNFPPWSLGFTTTQPQSPAGTHNPRRKLCDEDCLMCVHSPTQMGSIWTRRSSGSLGGTERFLQRNVG